MTLFRLLLGRVCLFALFAPAAGLTQPGADPTLDARAAAAAERHRARTDDVLGRAREEMALLVIPTVNLDAPPPRDFGDATTRVRFTRQSSTLMHWRHTTKEGVAFTVGQGPHKFNSADTGPLFQTPRGEVVYQVIPVWPGEYRLNRITYHQPQATAPAPTRRLESSAMLDKLGMATLDETTDIDFRKTGPWPQPENPSDDGLGEGCQVTLRFGAGCDEAAREFRWRLNASLAVTGGVAERVPVAGVDTELLFSPVATITLKVGEAVLIDGFTLPGDQPVLGKDSCRTLAEKLICPLETMTLKRLPVSIEDFRQAPAAGSFNMPKLDAALRDLVYREPTYYFKPRAATPDLIEMRM
jgi:hypothetical protein